MIENFKRTGEKMRINIYQIDPKKDNAHILFLGLDEIKTMKKENDLSPDIYKMIFSGEVDCEDLEGIYRKFNIDAPNGYIGRSLSVSDVIEVVESPTVENGFYFCDVTGFQKIEFVKSEKEDGAAYSTEIERNERI